MPSSNSLNTATPFSITVWVKLNFSGTGSQLLVGRKDYDRGIIVNPGYGGYIYALFGNNSFTGAGVLSAGVWHNIAYVGTINGQSVYVDGKLVFTDAFTGATFVNANDIVFGSPVINSYTLNGFLDEVRIYSRALSTQEVLDIYNDNGAIISPPTDTAPPVISGIASSGLTASSAVISWATNEPADGQVEYGASTSYGSTDILKSALITSHSISLSSLTPSTAYHYRVKSRDAAGNLSISNDQIFTTTAGIIPPQPSLTGNGIIIENKSGNSQTNYPVQIGRPFMPGEIMNYPQVVLGGVPIFTQADVKNRYPDGSVKFAILSFFVPSLPSAGQVSAVFQNQTSGNNTPLSKTEMLDSKYDFNAQMLLTNGTTLTADARTMLSNGDYTVWASGPVATTIILADHTNTQTCNGYACSRYDIGFNSNKPFRPIFQATFWPTINKVNVRFIGEVAETEQLEDLPLTSLILKTGQTNSNINYTKSSFTMYAASRWTKKYWIGADLPDVAINHNLSYLTQTKFIPNYDTTKSISESVLASQYSKWSSTAKDLYDAGEWTKAMGTTGGRPDIGPYPQWTVNWMYTGDKRMQDRAFGNADLAAAWPVHLREGKSGKYLDRSKTVSGLGRVLSISSRPTIALAAGYNYSYTNLQDRVVPVGSVTNGGWWPDLAHQPDPFSPQYILSGDFFYLEESEFWASWFAATPNGAATAYSYGRGPTGSEGGICGYAIGNCQVRGQAWGLRGRAQTAFIIPDNFPEKNYFENLINDTIAIWEGMRNITGTQFQGNANWNWGKTVGAKGFGSLGPPTLHQWEAGSPAFVQAELNPAVVSSATSPWEQDYLIYAFGRARELGYSTEALLSWLGENLIGQVNNPGYNPYLAGAYRLPTIATSDNKYFPTWSAAKSSFFPEYQNITVFPALSYFPNCADCYPYIALSAMSMVADQPGGGAAWSWISNMTLSQPALNNYPSWAILPRSINAVVPVDTTAPTIPTNLSATSTSASQINLTWTASTDNVAVAGYKIFKGGVQIGTAAINSYFSTGLSASTPYTYTVSSYDGAGNNSSQSMPVSAATQVPEVVLPVISNLLGSNTTATTTKISWNTNVPTDGQISYGLTTSYGSQSVIVDNATKTTLHTVTLTSISPATTYHFRVTSVDSKGNKTVSPDFTFTTLSTAPLLSAPIISAFTSSPTIITQGSPIVLFFSVTDNPTTLSIDNGIGSVLGQSFKTVSPTVTTIYTLTATNSAGTATAQVRVIVNPIGVSPPSPATATAPSITSFTASPASITVGQTAMLAWVVIGTSTPVVSINIGLGTQAGKSIAVSPTITTIYTLTATNSAGSATAQVRVVVNPQTTATPGGTGNLPGNVINTNLNNIVVYIPPAPVVTPVNFPIINRLKLINHQGTYYFIQNGQRYGITNPGILNSYGFTFSNAKTSTEEESGLPVSGLLSPEEGSLVKTAQNPTVYLISNGQKHGFTSVKVFTGLGHKFSSVLTVTAPELDVVPQGDIISNANARHPKGVNIVSKGTIYFVGQDTIYPYPSIQVYNSWNIKNDFTNVVPANSADLYLPVGGAVEERLFE